MMTALHCISLVICKEYEGPCWLYMDAFRLRVVEGLIYIESVLYIDKWNKSCSRVFTLLIRFAGLDCRFLNMR